jgi:hypothetical protein
VSEFSADVAGPGDQPDRLLDLELRRDSELPVSATWGQAVQEWRSYCLEKQDENLFFLGDSSENRDEILVSDYTHRWTDAYTKRQYAKIQSFIRGAFSEYEDPHLVFITRSCSTTDDAGNPRSPIVHLNELIDAWSDGVRYELDKVMGAKRKKDQYHGFAPDEWEYLRILEPTTEDGYGPSGYAHEHTCIVVDGDPGEQRFHSVLEKHVEKAETARLDAHEFEDTIEVREHGELENPGAYVFKYLGKTWQTGEMEEYEERFAALLKETGRRRFQPSDGAQRWMQPDEDESESGDWVFAGIGTDRQAQELQQFNDYRDFLIATGADGLRSWLAERRGVGLDRDRSEERREQLQSRLDHEEYHARIRADLPMPWEDTPPPG